LVAAELDEAIGKGDDDRRHALFADQLVEPFRQLLKAPGRTRSASRKTLSPSYATILRARKKIMKPLFLRNVAHDQKA
jgi:hypothetical protein